MRNWERKPAAPQQIDVLLFDAFSALCLANTIEPLRAANRLSGSRLYSWRYLTLDGPPAVSSSDMQVMAHTALAGCRGDILIAMPSYDFLRHATPESARGLRAASRRYGTLAGFDTGSWLLAQAGLLEGYEATIHWEELEQFREAFPGVKATRARHIQDGSRITCSGAQAAFEVMMDLIGQRHGQALRLEVASLFMSPEATSDHTTRPARGRIVASALALMQANLEHPVQIARIAAHVGRSQKDLERRMRDELGAPPQTVYRRLRLIHAKKLVLETNLGVSEIALRSGYEDPSALTRAFREEFGLSPTRLRQSLN